MSSFPGSNYPIVLGNVPYPISVGPQEHTEEEMKACLHKIMCGHTRVSCPPGRVSSLRFALEIVIITSNCPPPPCIIVSANNSRAACSSTFPRWRAEFDGHYLISLDCAERARRLRGYTIYRTFITTVPWSGSRKHTKHVRAAGGPLRCP